ncbi:TonB-dependent receptor [uncultured Ilyobacter sp.]|uniref:TonB-dependent receptor family protein n=1 Tax=uncultured Ilyobacter sp. TaxID=544433 RepID=UPI0029C710F5|nr:TonB-dependent receptor [uncultured Ilyobacter sp.]
MKKNLLWALMLVSAIAAKGEDIFYEEESIASVKLNESVITGEKFETTVRNTPKGITVITSEEIENSGAKDVSDILKFVPGIKSEGGTNGDGQLNYRGQGSMLPMSYTKTVIFVDGIKLNTMDSKVELNEIPIENVQKIEVIPGGSVIAGSVAGGVINIITKDDYKMEPFNQIRTEYGSYNSYRSGVSAGVNIGTDWLIQGNYDLYNSEGYRDDRGREKESAGVQLKRKLNDTDYLSFKYDYYYKKFDSAGSLSKEEVIEDRRQVDPSYNPNYYESEQNLYVLTYENELSDQFSFITDLYFKHYETYSLTSAGSGVTENDFDTYGISPRIQYKYLNDARLILGYDGYKTEGDYSSNSKGSKKWDEDSHAAFLTNRFKYGNFEFVQGYRRQWDDISYNYIDDKNDNYDKEFSNDAVELGANYYYSDTGSLFLNFNTNFLVPSTTYLKDADNADNVDEQTAETIEFGLKECIGNTFASLAFYQTVTDNEIYYDSPASKANRTYKNIDGETKRQGVELSLEHRFGKLTMKEAYSWIDPKITDGNYDGNQIPGASKNLFNLYASYQITPRFNIAMNNYYVGSYYAKGDLENTGEKVDNYWITDLIAFYDLQNGLKLETGIRNIFNEKYYDSVSYSNSSNELSYYPAEERNYYVGLNYTF